MSDLIELAQKAVERDQLLTVLQFRAYQADMDLFFRPSIMGDESVSHGARWVVKKPDGMQADFLFLHEAINKLIDLLMEAEDQPDA